MASNTSSTPLFDEQDKFVLKDGRSIGYLIAGDKTSPTHTVVHCAANAACRYMAHTVMTRSNNTGIRLIGVDRPGIGLTDPQTNDDESLIGFAHDVLELLDHLKVEQFSVIGESVGTPHALALAHEAKEKVQAVGLLSPVGPPGTYDNSELTFVLKFGVFISKNIPSVGSFLLKTGFASKWKKAREDTEALIEFEKFVIENDYPNETDKEFAKTLDRETWISMGADNVESFRQGPRGTLNHFRLCFEPWGYKLQDVSVPVFLYWGEQDTFMPRSMVETMAEELPTSTLYFEKDSATLSTMFKCMEQALKDVTSSN